MNYDEHPDDSTLTRKLRDDLSALAVCERPPLATITSRGRARQRRRLAALGGLGSAGLAAGAALALGLTGGLGTGGLGAGGLDTGTARGAATSTTGIAAPVQGPSTTGTIRTAAFILTSNGNGTDTLTLTMSQVFDPAVFQRALAQHGIPAIVKTDDTFCASSPAPLDPVSSGVLTAQLPFKLARKGMARVAPGEPKSGDLGKLLADTKTVINPAAIPAGTELFFSYSPTGHALYFALIYKSHYTCSYGQPPAA
jgi:hypothetical protein